MKSKEFLENKTIINNFSKLEKNAKIEALQQYCNVDLLTVLNGMQCTNSEYSKIINELSENVISNYALPYSIAPNFLINNKIYHIPMVTEESSVVAAAAKAAKIWAQRGGFKAVVKNIHKSGQVHFIFHLNKKLLFHSFPALKEKFFLRTASITENMRKRGGGIIDIQLIDKNDSIKNYYQLHVLFDTVDAMGANFINTCLEVMTDILKKHISETTGLKDISEILEFVMPILSNYNPDCIVESFVECNLDELNNLYDDWSGEKYTKQFSTALAIANTDIYRATTHNKGIFNGIDAVAMATGNDYRAIEAGGHAFATKNGQYRSLSKVEVSDNKFRFSLEIPLSVGTVGGITAIHPLAKLSHEILNKPDSKTLMMIMASVGLASNFSAIHALITSGIQKGHMKLHLVNILNQLQASNDQKLKSIEYFAGKTVSFSAVEQFLKSNE